MVYTTLHVDEYCSNKKKKTNQFFLWLGVWKSAVELLKEPLSSNTSGNSIILSHEEKHMEGIFLIKSVTKKRYNLL